MSDKIPSITFYGGAETVTGSKTLLRYKGVNVLIDCGLFQGLKKLRLKNRESLRFKPEKLNAIILTHAHLDHSGSIPLIVKEGFKGPIYCTEPTFDLAKIILLDSAKIQEEDAERANRYGYTKHHPAKPLYTLKDANNALSYFVKTKYNEVIKLNGDISFSFQNAGHIVGSSWVAINAGGKKIVFSGDIGRTQPLILNTPKRPEIADYLIMESTYGNRLHPETSAKDSLAEAINLTFNKGGSVIIPTFAVERAQEILYLLNQLLKEKQIPNLPIFLDSPMGIDATEVMLNYPDWHKLTEDACKHLCDNITLVDTVEHSKSVVRDTRQKIVLAGSGMISGGRVLHHLNQGIGDSRNTILLVGFQAKGTRGRALINGMDEIKFFGEYHKVKAEVMVINGLSAHADQSELIDWISELNVMPKTIFLNHGEADASNALKQKIEDSFGIQSEVAQLGLSYLLK